MSLPHRIPDRANAGMHMLRTARTELYCNQRDVLIIRAEALTAEITKVAI
jgi:hypothetical protein